MGAGFACPTEEKLHQPEISVRYGGGFGRDELGLTFARRPDARLDEHCAKIIEALAAIIIEEDEASALCGL